MKRKTGNVATVNFCYSRIVCVQLCPQSSSFSLKSKLIARTLTEYNRITFPERLNAQKTSQSHSEGCREFDITEIDITETAIMEFDITDIAITESDITESDITRKGKLL